MKVGVTGGQGFISSYIRSELIRRGHQTVIFDRHDHTTIKFPSEEFFLGDVNDAEAVTELAAHVDAIIHMAAVLGTQETITNPRPSAQTNILGSLNVFESANQYDLPVVYPGVGNHFMRSEGAGSYVISKTATEDYAKMFNKNRNGKITVVRPCNAIGPGQSVAAPYGPAKVRKIAPAFICRALTGAPIEVYGDGEQISDCVHVKDVANVIVGALEYTAANGPIDHALEVGPVVSHTVNNVAYLVANLVATKTGTIPVQVNHLPMRPGEVPGATVSANPETLRVLGDGYQAENFIPLEVALSQTIDYFREEWLPNYNA